MARMLWWLTVALLALGAARPAEAAHARGLKVRLAAKTAPAGAKVRFTTNGTTAPRKDRIVRWRLTFGDSAKPRTGRTLPKQVIHVYRREGRYVARLTVWTKRKRHATSARTLKIPGVAPRPEPALLPAPAPNFTLPDAPSLVSSPPTVEPPDEAGRVTRRSDGTPLALTLGNVRVDVPAGAIAPGQTVTLAANADASGLPAPGPKLGTIYSLTTSQGQPSAPVLVTMPYSWWELSDGDHPVLLHGSLDTGVWAPESTSVDERQHTISATLDHFSLLTWTSRQRYQLGLLTGTRADGPSGCQPANVPWPDYLRGAFLPNDPSDALRACISSKTTSRTLYLNVVNNRAYAQVINLYGAKLSVSDSSWGDSSQQLFAGLVARVQTAHQPADLVLAPLASATLAIPNPAPAAGPVEVKLSYAPRHSYGFSTLAFSLFVKLANIQQLSTLLDSSNCVLSTFAHGLDDDTSTAAAVTQLRECVSALANLKGGALKTAMEKINNVVLLSEALELAYDIRADELFPPEVSFTFQNAPLVNPKIKIAGATLGVLPAAQESTRVLTASGGKPPYTVHLSRTDVNAGKIPGWTTLAADGTLTVRPPPGVAGSFAFHVYASDAAGQRTNFNAALVSFAVPDDTGTVPSPPLQWGGPRQLIHGPPYRMFDGSGGPTAIDCPSREFCAAVAYGGLLLVSEHPDSRDVRDWPTIDGPFSLNDIACPSVSLCVAVAGNGTIVTSTDPTGGPRAWTEVEVPYGLIDIVCPSIQVCLINSTSGLLVSEHPADGEDDWTLTGTHWVDSCFSPSLCLGGAARSSVIQYSTNPTGGDGTWRPTGLEALQYVSCPSTQLCVGLDAAGNAYATNAPTGSGPWRRTAPDPDPKNIAIGLDCPSVNRCVALDGLGRILTSINPAAVSSQWMPYTPGLGNLVGLECPSDDLCLVIATSGQLITSSDPTRTWSAPLPVAGVNARVDIECPSEHLCIGADTDQNLITTTDPAGNAPWSVEHREPVIVDTVLNYLALPAACLSESFCLAPATAGGIFSSSAPGAGLSSWRLEPAPAGTGPSGRIVCASSSFCASLDDYGRFRASTTPSVPASWRSSATIEPGLADDLTGFDCPSANLCVIVSTFGRIASTRNPAAVNPVWTQVDADIVYARGITCPTTTLCLIFADTGHVWRSIDPTGPAAAWAPTMIAPGNTSPRFTDFTCPSAEMCAALDGGGNVIVTDDPLGPANAWTSTPLNTTRPFEFSSIACPSRDLCVAVDDTGNVYTGQRP